jgi:hypothetical protein
VDASGGTFKLHITAEEKIEVFTSRGQKRFVFSPDGLLLQEDSYRPLSYSDLPSSPTHSRFFATPWFLWPFAHPFAGWGVAMIGMVGLVTMEKGTRKAKP